MLFSLASSWSCSNGFLTILAACFSGCVMPQMTDRSMGIDLGKMLLQTPQNLDALSLQQSGSSMQPMQYLHVWLFLFDRQSFV